MFFFFFWFYLDDNIYMYKKKLKKKIVFVFQFNPSFKFLKALSQNSILQNKRYDFNYQN